MVLAGETLFIAGPPDVVEPQNPMAAIEGRRGGRLWALAAADGRTLAEYSLQAPPQFDGLIAARGGLYLVTTDGRVLCMADSRSSSPDSSSGDVPR